MKGIYLAFENGEGGSKGTQIARLTARLEQGGFPVVNTREPGGTTLGEHLRGVLFDKLKEPLFPEGEKMDARTEALLFAAQRAELVRRVIRPGLDAGKVVIGDRSLFTSLSYQGHARFEGAEYEAIRDINRWAVDYVLPDPVYLLDLDPRIGLARKQGQDPEEWNRFEAELLAFHEACRAGYLAVAEEFPQVRVIDATQTVDEIHEEIWDDLQGRLRS